MQLEQNLEKSLIKEMPKISLLKMGMEIEKE